MKRNSLYKILLVLILCFCFMCNAKADLRCDTEIQMKGIVPGGFDVKVAYCEFTFNGSFSGVATDSSYSGVVAKKDSYTYSQMASTSSKVGSSGPVPLCNYKGNGYKVIETSTCTATKNVVKDTCEYDYTCVKDKPAKPPITGPVNERMSAVAEGCQAGYHLEKSSTCTQYYKCPSGYGGQDRTTNSGAKCTKDIPVSMDVTSGNYKDQSTLESDCGTVEDTSCSCTEPVYELQCPVFICQRRDKINGACYEKFQIKDGPTAYCVNPSEHYPAAGGNNYKYDYRFDVQKCSSSHSTIDCGYANIMIEASYNNKKYSMNITEGAISLALRLWGAHSKVSGFGNVGLANTESNCSSLMIYHMDMPNVYKVSVGYITNHLFNKVSRYIEDNENTVYNLLNGSGSPLGSGFEYIDGEGTKHTYITCDVLGLVCGDGSKSYVYRSAFALYFNTLKGNSAMLDHLRELYGGASDTTPEGASLIDVVEGAGSEMRLYSKVEILFPETITHESYEEDVMVDCDKVENDPSYKYYKTKVDGARILPYCRVTFTIVDEDGNILVDKDGKALNQLKLDECNLKNFGCYSKKLNFAICDFIKETKKTASIVVHYTKTKKSYSVRKYIACEHPNDNQIMFAFYSKENEKAFTRPDPGTTTFTIIPYCKDDSCTDTGIRKSKGTCDNSSATETKYGEVFTSYVKDPPLNCLLHSRITSEYDYSEVFGVNTDVCRIYCSDSVEYIMADKIRAKSGTSVKFNIEFQATKMKRANHLLTSVIRERRTCVSKIFVGSNNFESGYDWGKQYGITASEIQSVTGKTYIENAEQLLKILIKKSTEENERKENINKLIFDLYNCNLYSKAAITSKVSVSNSKKVKYVVDEIKNKYSVNNNFGLYGCSIYDSNGDYKNDCVVMGNTTYEGSAEIGALDSNGFVYDSGNVVGRNPGISMNAYATKDSDKDYENTIRFALSQTKYCTNQNCVKYNGNDSSKSDYKKDDYDVFNNKYFVTDSTEGKVSWTDPNTGKKHEYTIPKNIFALFEITTDFGFYNKEKFQVYPNNGYVRNITNGGKLDGLLPVDNYSYPSSKEAYNQCSIKDVDGSNGGFNRCLVTYNVDSIHSYERNYKSSNFMTEINNMNKFNCYIDFEPPQLRPYDEKDTTGLKDSTLYRNIDTAKMFNNTPAADSNWNSYEGLIAIGMIESTSEDLKLTDDYLEYKITLSPTQIKAIRSDINRNNTGDNAYIKERVYGCKIVDDSYRECKSEFLDLLRKSASETNSGTFGNIDPNYSTGLSVKAKEEEYINNNNKLKGH